MKIGHFFGLAGLALIAAIWTSAGDAAAQEFKSLQGAWLAKGADCADVYQKSGRGTSFRKPVDLFAPAFMIVGNRLTTPGATCRIKSAKPSGNLQQLVLDCVNAIGSNDVRVLVSSQSDGSLNRYLNAQDTTGTPHQNCAR